jgi:glycine cleavage system aminomethyltransferase T
MERLLTTAGKGLTLLQTDVTCTYAMFWLFGLHSNDVLQQVTHYDVRGMAPGSCVATGLAGVPAILVHPPTPTIANMRILTGWDVAEYLWERIWQAGQTWHVSPLGMDGLDMLLNQGKK